MSFSCCAGEMFGPIRACAAYEALCPGRPRNINQPNESIFSEWGAQPLGYGCTPMRLAKKVPMERNDQIIPEIPAKCSCWKANRRVTMLP
jgi:hypothetical protein